MKLIIQIPCYNERNNLAETIKGLPREIQGIDEIEVLVIDDGSTDGTSELAEELGVHYIIRFANNKGLAAAHMAGLDACLRLGADIVVNTDGDNQYCGEDIRTLVKPIIDDEADIVIGDRQTDTIEHFSPIKKLLQKWGSGVVRRTSGTQVIDSTSGFRAFSRRSLYKLFVHNKFTYTLETIIQAGRLGLTIKNVPIQTNLPTRKSRLAKSTFDYLRRNGLVILRSYSMYWPVQVFGLLAIVMFVFGVGLTARFLYYYIQAPEVSSHIQSLQVGIGSLILAFLVGLMAVLGDLIATNRRLLEESLARIRHIDVSLSKASGLDESYTTKIHKTGHKEWVSEDR